MNEMSSGDATVGSILGAMVYQIGEQQERRHKKGLEQAQPEASTMSQGKTTKLSRQSRLSNKKLAQ